MAGHDGAVRRTIKSFAVNAHARRDDQILDRLFDQRFQQNRRAEIIGSRVTRDFIHALPDADFGRQMKHRIDAAQRLSHRVAVADVAADEFHFVVKIFGTRAIVVHLLRQRVESAHAVAARQQFVGEMRPQKPGAAHDKNLLAHKKESRAS